MNWALIALATIFMGCARAPSIAPTEELRAWSKEFDALAVEFGSQARAEDAEVRIESFPEADDSYAICRQDWKVIQLGPAWPLLSPARRKAVFFHELGHCVLGRMEHEALYTHGPDAHGIPQSYMYKYAGALGDRFLEACKDAYNYELFRAKDTSAWDILGQECQ